jgi:hypothetical protein
VIEVPEGHGILLSPGHLEHFHFARHRETRLSWVAVGLDLIIANLRRELQSNPGPLPFLGSMARLLDIARYDSVTSPESDLLHVSACESLGVTIICEFASAARDRKKATRPSETVLWRMDRFLAESYAAPLDLNDIAPRCGCFEAAPVEALPHGEPAHADGAALCEASRYGVGSPAAHRILDRGNRRSDRVSEPIPPFPPVQRKNRQEPFHLAGATLGGETNWSAR